MERLGSWDITEAMADKLKAAPPDVYGYVADELTAMIEADIEPRVIGFPSRDRLAVSYPLLVNRDGWSVIGSAEFEVEREPGSMQPGVGDELHPLRRQQSTNASQIPRGQVWPIFRDLGPKQARSDILITQTSNYSFEKFKALR